MEFLVIDQYGNTLTLGEETEIERGLRYTLEQTVASPKKDSQILQTSKPDFDPHEHYEKNGTVVIGKPSNLSYLLEQGYQRVYAIFYAGERIYIPHEFYSLFKPKKQSSKDMKTIDDKEALADTILQAKQHSISVGTMVQRNDGGMWMRVVEIRDGECRCEYANEIGLPASAWFKVAGLRCVQDRTS